MGNLAAANAIANLVAHLGDTANPHTTTAAHVGNLVAQWNADKLQDADIGALTPEEAHTLLYSGGQFESGLLSVLFYDVVNKTASSLAPGDAVVWGGGVLNGVITSTVPNAAGFAGLIAETIAPDATGRLAIAGIYMAKINGMPPIFSLLGIDTVAGTLGLTGPPVGTASARSVSAVSGGFAVVLIRGT